MTRFKTINRVDSISINADRALTSAELAELQSFSSKTSCHLQSVRYHPQWKFIIKAAQPLPEWFEAFRRIIGSDMTVELALVEIARDFLVRTRLEADRMHRYFLGTVLRPYQRRPVVACETTSYFGERASRSGTLKVYSDRTFKLAGVGPGPRCCHVEFRMSNLGVLLDSGLVTVQDLIDFDYDAFWAKKLRCIDLPSKTALGRLMGRPGGPVVENQAYVKRANKLYRDKAFHLPRGFVLQNAAIRYPGIRRLPAIPFGEWEEMARNAALEKINIAR